MQKGGGPCPRTKPSGRRPCATAQCSGTVGPDYGWCWGYSKFPHLSSDSSSWWLRCLWLWDRLNILSFSSLISQQTGAAFPVFGEFGTAPCCQTGGATGYPFLCSSDALWPPPCLWLLSVPPLGGACQGRRKGALQHPELRSKASPSAATFPVWAKIGVCSPAPRKCSDANHVSISEIFS